MRQAEDRSRLDTYAVRGCPGGGGDPRENTMNNHAQRVLLVVDDEEPIIKLIRSLLSDRYGCALLTANSGEEALKLIGQESIDLLLTDVVMPGMKGTELVKHARRIRPDL